MFVAGSLGSWLTASLLEQLAGAPDEGHDYRTDGVGSYIEEAERAVGEWQLHQLDEQSVADRREDDRRHKSLDRSRSQCHSNGNGQHPERERVQVLVETDDFEWAERPADTGWSEDCADEDDGGDSDGGEPATATSERSGRHTRRYHGRCETC